jgi:hypothetical protein
MEAEEVFESLSFVFAQHGQMVAAPRGVLDVVPTVLLCVVGGAMVLGSLWVLRGRRADHEARGEAKRAELARLGEVSTSGEPRTRERPVLRLLTEPRRLSEPTRLVIGLSLLLAGYHALAYGLPAAILPLRVPIDRLWMLGVGVIVACAVSVGMNRLQDRD